LARFLIFNKLAGANFIIYKPTDSILMNFDDLAGEKSNFQKSHIFFTRQKKEPTLKWLAGGHAVDLIDIDGKINVLGFLQSDDFLLPMSPLSTIQTLDECELLTITRGKLIFMLKKFPECHFHYKHFRRLHQDRIANYHQDLKTKTPGERYIDLLESHPRVKQLVTPALIASYLKVTQQQYEIMCRIE
jgi:hypothetical protein